MANEFKVRKGLIVQGSGSNIFDVQGSQGQLFSVTDSLSGSLFSVNDISGIPIMEVFSDNTIKMGTFNQEAIIISGSRTGMGTAFPQAELHISGANNQSLLQVSSPSATSSLFVSGSGNVGIGTATPTNTLNVNGTTFLQGGQTTVRGSGATSATTALRVENSAATARLTILDDGTSAFNTSHLYVSSSGIIGIGTATPTMGILDINGIARVRSTNQLYFGGTGAGDWQGAISGQASGLLVNLNLLTINNSGYASPATQSFRIDTSQNVAVGPHSPTARLHVSGASNSNLLQVSSPTNTNILFVSGSGNMGIGTATPTQKLHIVNGNILLTDTYYIDWSSGSERIIGGGSGTGYSLQFSTYDGANLTEKMRISGSGEVGIGVTTPSARLHISGASNSNLLRISSPAQTNILFVSGSGNVGIGTGTPAFRLDVSGSAKFGTGSVGFASGLGQIHAVDRTGAYITATQTTSSIVTFMGADSNGGIIGTYSSHNLLIRTNNSNKITVEPTNIGIQTTPSDWIHLSSEPGASKYLNIDAAQTSNPPPLNGGTAKTGYGIVANDNYLAEPDYWMEIKLGGTVVLIPCYLPA